MGPPHAKKVLKDLRPDTARGSSIRLVKERPKVFTCQVQGCIKAFAEMKEVNRHFKRAHAGGANTARGGGGGNFNCPEPGCSRSFKTPGWLDRHLRSDHAAPSVPQANTTTVLTPTFTCKEPGCSAAFKTSGWLDRHTKSKHPGLAVPGNPSAPPPTGSAGDEVGTTSIPPGNSVVKVFGGGGSTRPSRTNPVSSPGDGSAGQTRSQRSRDRDKGRRI